jgi:Tfp pilus assembly protein PilO
MSSKMKQWVALTAVGCLAVLAAGWFLLVSPKRGDAAAIRDEVASQNTTNSSLQTQLAMLKAQAKTLPAQQAKLALVAAKIPDNPALPALIRALSKAADDAGVELVSLAPGQPATVVAAAPAAPAPGATTTGPAAGSGAAVGAQAAGLGTTSKPAGAPVTLGSTTAGASSFSPGVLTSIPLTINVVGGYFQVEQFFDRVEQLARATKVTGFTMVPGANPMKPSTGAAAQQVDTGKTLTTAVTANVYMAPGRGTVPTVTAPVK